MTDAVKGEKASSATKLRVLLHAPTAGSLARARSNAKNLQRVEPNAEIEIIINALGVAAAIEMPDPTTDQYLRYCANTLKHLKLTASEGSVTIPAAVLYLAQKQAEGWAYIRA